MGIEPHRDRPSAPLRSTPVVAAALLLIVVAASLWLRRPWLIASSDEPSATADCGPLTYPELQFGLHLIAGNPPPVPYSSSPPTSGWHASGRFDIAVQPRNQPLPEPVQVSVLEVGGGVVSYHDLPDDELAELREHVDAQHAGRVAVTPYDKLETGHVAFTAWGVVQDCEALDLDALDRFVDAYVAPDPDVPGTR